MHIDVNNAFLSWTAVDLLNKGFKYDIRNSYAVIGGDPRARQGVVLAKSTPCKKIGIVSAETLYSAKKKCPALKVYEPDFKLYSEMSSKLFELLSKYSPDIEVASVDECYLDYGKVKSLYGDVLDFAYKLKEEIKNSLGFTVNIGIANNKLCAKMASDFSKPDKVHTLFEEEVATKMYPLPIGELFGIGKKSSEKLINLNIMTIGDLAEANPSLLERYFKNQVSSLIERAKGIDYGEVISEKYIPDSISNEVTLLKDVTKKEDLNSYLLSLSESVAIRLREQKKYATVICVILKDNYFRRTTHQRKLKNATNVTSDIFKISKEILNEMDLEQVRLIGIRLDKLVDSVNYQVSLFDSETREEKEAIDSTIDILKQKYGSKAVTKASLIKEKERAKLKL